MPYTIARFDLDESVPIGNVPRPASKIRRVLPSGFPFLVDAAREEIVAPVLLFLAEKYVVPGAFKNGAWTKNNSASAAAADLKDWWGTIGGSDVPWDCADDSLVADWLIDMKTSISGHTKDFLEDGTVKRRASNVAEFYRWAFARKLVERVPEPDAAKRLAALRLTNPKLGRTYVNAHRSKYDRDPHPISPEVAAPLAAELGPLPSEGREASSRTRLAFELGYETGMRIDEILNLPHLWFADFEFDPKRPFVMTSFEIEITKGLVRREINVPAWLMEELRLYVVGERAAAQKQGERSWLKSGRRAVGDLFLNQTAASHNAGKATQASTIQNEFHSACLKLKIHRRRIRAKGTPQESVILVPKHTFHDTRHSYAVLLFRSLEKRGRVRPWIRVQKALGHAQVSTTTGIYLNVVDHLGSEALEQVAQTLHGLRHAWRGDQAMTAEGET